MKGKKVNYVMKAVKRMESERRCSFWGIFDIGNDKEIEKIKNASPRYKYFPGSEENVYFTIYLYDWEKKEEVEIGQIYSKSIYEILGGTPIPSLEAYVAIHGFIYALEKICTEIFYE